MVQGWYMNVLLPPMQPNVSPVPSLCCAFRLCWICQDGGIAWVQIQRSDKMWTERQKYIFDRKRSAHLTALARLETFSLAFVAAPYINRVQPRTVNAAGGTLITITGSSFGIQAVLKIKNVVWTNFT